MEATPKAFGETRLVFDEKESHEAVASARAHWTGESRSAVIKFQCTGLMRTRSEPLMGFTGGTDESGFSDVANVGVARK